MQKNTYPANCKPRLRILALCGALLGPATAMAAPPPPNPTPEAIPTPAAIPNPEALFGEAVRLFKNGENERALPLFIQLGETTNSPNAFLYVGYCQLNLGHERAAHQAFSRAVKLSLEPPSDKYLETREAAQIELGKLNLRLANLTISFVSLPAEAVVRLDGEVIENAQLGSPLAVPPGPHHVEAESPGSKPIARDVSLEAGGFKVLALLFEKETEAPQAIGTQSPRRSDTRLTTMGWIAGGVGLTGLGTFVIAGLQSRGIYRTLQSECPAGCDDAAHRDDANRGKLYQTVANVGLGLGLVGTLTGATLVYLGTRGTASGAPSVAVSQGSFLLSYAGGF